MSTSFWSQFAPEQRYTSEYDKTCFRLTGIRRRPVTVQFEGTHLTATSEGKTYRLGLVEFGELARWVAKATLTGDSYEYADHPGQKPKWFCAMTVRVMRARLYPAWKQWVSLADANVLAVQRRIFAAAYSPTPAVAMTEELYRHRHVVRDLSRYRAAAIAAVAAGHLSMRLPWILERFPWAAQRQRAEGLRSLLEPCPAELDPFHPATIELILELLHDWQALFAPDGMPYGSLRRTLMNLPGGITPSVLCSLANVRLERPVTDRLELITVCTAAQKRRRDHDHVFAHARHDEIVEAMGIVAEERRQVLGQPAGNPCGVLSPRRTKDIAFFTGYLCDFPDLHRGRIVGLARKAVAWHRDEAAMEDRRSLEQLGLERPTALPPIPLPDIEGVRFLSSVGEILEEGRRMRHCVASYAKDAVQGLCYLFHVDYGDEEATVEVNRGGRVLQSQGPGNGHNVAAKWGRHQLEAWASSFPVCSKDAIMLPF